jgi:hypothetical protein
MNHLKLLPVFVLSFTAAVSVVAQPLLQIDRANGSARISLETEPGSEYRIEGSTALPLGWEFLATLQAPGGPVSWYDAQSTQLPQRYYRAVQQEAAPAETAQDFRLLDQLGRTRRLYYYFGAPGVRSIVLIFAGNGCAKLREMAPAINALTNRFSSQGVLFWLIDSNTGDTRSNILVEATSLDGATRHRSCMTPRRPWHEASRPKPQRRRSPSTLRVIRSFIAARLLIASAARPGHHPALPLQRLDPIPGWRGGHG